MKDNGKETFQFSLIEFVLFTSFCFLLVSVLSIRQNEELVDKASDSIRKHNELEAMRGEIEKLKKNLVLSEDALTIQKYLEMLNVQISEPLPINDNWQTITLVNGIVKKHQLLPSDIERIIVRANQAEEYRLELDRLATKYGRDLQNCIEPHAKTTNYLARVVLFGDHVEVEPLHTSFPKSYSREKSWDYSHFEKFGQAMVFHGDSKPIKCRYYVRVATRFGPNDSVETYQMRMKTLETYFYKYLENNG